MSMNRNDYVIVGYDFTKLKNVLYTDEWAENDENIDKWESYQTKGNIQVFSDLCSDEHLYFGYILSANDEYETEEVKIGIAELQKMKERARVKSEANEKARAEYESFLNKFGKSKEFKAYVKAAQNLYNAFEDKNPKSNYGSNCMPWYFVSSFENLDEVKPSDMLKDNVSTYGRYNDDTMKEVRDRVNELDLAQESLMIKLTYEKDIETVRAMLAEYDITI